MKEDIGKIPEKNRMSKNAKKLRDFYDRKPDAPFFQEEFGYYSIEKWKSQGHFDDSCDIAILFGLEKDNEKNGVAKINFYGLGGCEAAFSPDFEVKILEDRGDHELVQDAAGRSVLYFKGRRNGFMPEYVDHPVKDMKTWQENVKWRLDPDSKERFIDIENNAARARKLAEQGTVLSQTIIGGYMFLRSLMGPEGVMYKFYDEPELIHDCMQTWYLLADKVCAEHQKYVSLDEIFLSEDICYKCGSLISPEMIKEFLFPYYSQLITNCKKRQLDKNRHLFIQLDTDGNCLPIIDLYIKGIGMDYLCPFEAASGCDVVEVRKKYPDLLIRGGFDKRILAAGKEAIEVELQRIMPFMKKHGGYIPTCDHGVPEEVNFDDYLYFRRRLQEI